jgi:hypothetical protein
VTGAPFHAVGGAILADHGPLSLKEARALAVFYAREAVGEGGARAGFCMTRSLTLARAAYDAERWRRAAGWTDPDLAD